MPPAPRTAPPLWRLPFRAAWLAWSRLPRGRLAAFLALAVVSILIATFADILIDWLDPRDFPPENGPLELLQAFVLALTAITLFIGLFRLRFEVQFFCAVTGYILIFAFLRETPRCVSEFYEGGVCIDNEWKPVVIAVWTALFALALWRHPLRWAKRLEELNFFWVVPMALTALLIVASQIASFFVWVTTEETLELAAYLNLFFFSVALLRAPERFDVEATTAGRAGA